MAEMNFGPPLMSMTSGPRLTYGAIISSTQLFIQAQWQIILRSNASSSPNLPPRPKPSSTSPSVQGSVNDRIDSARKEWERATPENLRRMHVQDLRKILNPAASNLSTLGQSVIASGSSMSKLDFSNYVSSNELTVPLLSAPRLIKRPFDPLICENIILSKATALGPLPVKISRRASSPKLADTSRGRSPLRDGGIGGSGNSDADWSDPWFDSMNEDNTRLALEVNLVLALCQALEGVRSPRLAVRDRQLIVRETATELGVFFDFLNHSKQFKEWRVAAALVDPENDRVHLVHALEDIERRLPARLDAKASFHKVTKMVAMLETINEEPLEELVFDDAVEIITTGCFNVHINMTKFLPLLGKLFKSVVESLDSAQFV